MSADFFDNLANEARLGVGLEPALGAAPVDQLATGQGQARCVSGQRQPPQRLVLVEEAQALFIKVGPIRAVQPLTAQTVMGGGHRAFTALKAKVQVLAVVTRGADRQRLLAPFRQAQQGPFGVHFQTDAQGLPGFGQDLERDFRDQPQGAVTAGHQSRQVVAGDVFHHLATEAQMLAETGDHPGAEDKIAHRAGPRPTRPRQPAGNHAAHGGIIRKGRRFTGQHLLCGVQHLLELGQRRAAARGDHQLGRVVTDDAAV
ncbi:hypothetical protein D3C86_1379690 [compost metagenome]